MDRCPLCRAGLNGAETCRRCRAELQMAQRAERESQALADAAMHCLSLDDPDAAERLLRRALALHAAPETLALWQTVAASALRSDDAGAGEPQNARARNRTAFNPEAVPRRSTTPSSPTKGAPQP